MCLTSFHKDVLDYVINTGGNATLDSIDDDFEPIGPMLRNKLIPTYIIENDQGKLELTEEGHIQRTLFRD